MMQWASAPLRWLQPQRSAVEEEFWALQKVSFELREGEIAGIIGRNGAGKSTLLKLLSRITEPTTGRITLRGRVASLLEVGTGFHPELTGRENIFLNGALLGMTKAEVRARFDEIVAFAEVEKFIETPVKRYSSGMYVRLAFAVAAHLQPDILILDEVLAVGDAAFQRKCIERLGKVKQEGKTVLFVSHSMPNVLALCTRAILLVGGEVAADDSPTAVLDIYQRSLRSEAVVSNNKAQDSRITLVWVGDDEQQTQRVVSHAEAIRLHLEYLVAGDVTRTHVPYLRVENDEGQCVFHVSPNRMQPSAAGCWRASCEVPARLLNCQDYHVTAYLVAFTGEAHEVCDQQLMAVSFTVLEDSDNPARYGYRGPIPGMLWPQFEWEVKPLV
jgi:lipopolysaccharide transport system ATP-binding protein